MSDMGIYRLKPASQRLVAPIARWLATRGVAPDLITASAIPVSVLAAACLVLAEPHVRILLLAVPPLAAARIVVNLLDGMVARSTGRSHAMGELWNELADRLCDTLFIGSLAFVPGVDARVVLVALTAALLASYAGITARAAGGARQYGGVMSKPGRMATVAIVTTLAFATGAVGWLTAGAAVIAVGSALTLVQRTVAARRELGP
jgi:CDP-diacylglycerol--glycerol-3-phosphate 3-phosphatidyltransferase